MSQAFCPICGEGVVCIWYGKVFRFTRAWPFIVRVEAATYQCPHCLALIRVSGWEEA